MADLNRRELHRLARLGAQARLEELRREEAAIRSAFPDLFGGGGRGRGRKPNAETTATATSGHRRRRRRRGKLSAAGRAAISAAQKKRWAALKKKKASES